MPLKNRFAERARGTHLDVSRTTGGTLKSMDLYPDKGILDQSGNMTLILWRVSCRIEPPLLWSGIFPLASQKRFHCNEDRVRRDGLNAFIVPRTGRCRGMVQTWTAIDRFIEENSFWWIGTVKDQIGVGWSEHGNGGSAESKCQVEGTTVVCQEEGSFFEKGRCFLERQLSCHVSDGTA